MALYFCKMADYLSREQIKIPNKFVARQIGRELREEGYKLHSHPTWGHSIKIPSGEQLTETEMIVRYGGSDNEKFKKELEKALEYLVICEKILMKTSEVSRGFRLGD